MKKKEDKNKDKKEVCKSFVSYNKEWRTSNLEKEAEPYKKEANGLNHEFSTLVSKTKELKF